MRSLLASLTVLLATAAVVHADQPTTGPGTPRWYKGNLHTHSLWSDGDDFPEMIADWYKTQGYDFLAISDHNTLQAGDKWVSMSSLKKKKADVALAKYQARFGDKVITRGSNADQTLEIKLSPFETYRSWIEVRGKFLLIQAEEVTDSFEKRPIHMGAINVGEVIKPAGGKSVPEVIANNLRQIRAQAAKLNQPIFQHVNHPNFNWGITAEELASVSDEHFFEVYNGHPSIHFEGDEKHISIERMWDVANTIRIGQMRTAPLFGLGSDDSHNYHILGPNRSGPGRGWVMVRATSLTPAALIHAMEAGDFYASSGVTLTDVKFDPAKRTLTVDIAPDGDAKFTTRFIGTPKSAAGTTTVLTDERVGKTLATVDGTFASYQLTGDELYVRAVVTSDKPAASPSLKNQMKQAWTQPIGWQAADRKE